MTAKKVLLNQTHSRPICYAYSQTLVSAIPSKWKVARDIEIEEFKSIIPKIKEFVKNKLESLYPSKDMKVLSMDIGWGIFNSVFSLYITNILYKKLI